MTERAELRTERLLLRPFGLGDVEDVFQYATDEVWAQYLPVPRPYARDDAVNFVARAVLTNWKTEALFAIVLGSKVIGSVGVLVALREEVAELGYALGRPHWGRGLVPEAAAAAMGWAFEKYSLAKVYATADLRNGRSWRVMEKLGMTREAVLRSHHVERGERIDHVYYGLLLKEWELAAWRPETGRPGQG